jgi:hypothetical protein
MDAPKRGPGRPPSADPGKRQTMRWTDAEWTELVRRAKAAGMDRTKYVKSKVFAD